MDLICPPPVAQFYSPAANAQVRFDPFEEQLDQPARLVELCNAERVQVEMIGEKDESLLRLGVEIMNAPQRFGIALAE